MKLYRKRPVTVEAEQFVLGKSTKSEMLAFCPIAQIGASHDETDIRWFLIPTLEGDMEVRDGDFIIKGIEGEFYPCKPGIFHATYEPVLDLRV